MTEPTEVRVYVNERGVSLPHGCVALDAARALFPEHADAIVAGTMRLTDSRGLPIDASVSLRSGDIFRIVAVRDRAEADV